jgi:uncharacterized protein
MFDLEMYRSSVAELCRDLSVKRLEYVGSASRGDFDSESSDIDVLIQFEGDEGLFDRYFALKFGLERIFGRKVDVIQDGAVRNPHLRASLDQDRMAVYEA